MCPESVSEHLVNLIILYERGLKGDMEENKQIMEEQNTIDKDSVDILDLLETASSWLVSPKLS